MPKRGEYESKRENHGSCTFLKKYWPEKEALNSCRIGPITEKAGSSSTCPGYFYTLPTWEFSGHLKRKRGPICKLQRNSTSPIMKHDDDSALTLVLGTATPEKFRKAEKIG